VSYTAQPPAGSPFLSTLSFGESKRKGVARRGEFPASGSNRQAEFKAAQEFNQKKPQRYVQAHQQLSKTY